MRSRRVSSLVPRNSVTIWGSVNDCRLSRDARLCLFGEGDVSQPTFLPKDIKEGSPSDRIRFFVDGVTSKVSRYSLAATSFTSCRYVKRANRRLMSDLPLANDLSVRWVFSFSQAGTLSAKGTHSPEATLCAVKKLGSPSSSSFVCDEILKAVSFGLFVLDNPSFHRIDKGTFSSSGLPDNLFSTGRSEATSCVQQQKGCRS